MTARWYLAKHVPDPRRNEPRNVGVIVESHGRMAAMFLGEEDGRIDDLRFLSPLKVQNRQTYRAWVETWRRMMGEGAFEKVLSQRVGDPYYVELAGQRVSGEIPSPERWVKQLFSELVERPRPAKRPSPSVVADNVVRIIEVAHHVKFIHDVRLDTAVFDYFLKPANGYLKRVRFERNNTKLNARQFNDAVTCIETVKGQLQATRPLVLLHLPSRPDATSIEFAEELKKRAAVEELADEFDTAKRVSHRLFDEAAE
ncbi:MAG: hypothetical protein JJ863_21515 [Deltaproteobacteria bacterium]|nr:hypothetical protein [Deltaproteobacteria bacterium]